MGGRYNSPTFKYFLARKQNEQNYTGEVARYFLQKDIYSVAIPVTFFDYWNYLIQNRADYYLLNCFLKSWFEYSKIDFIRVIRNSTLFTDNKKLIYDYANTKTMKINCSNVQSIIYILFEQNSSYIYIGQTSNLIQRIYNHLYSPDNKSEKVWIKTLKRNNKNLLFSILDIVDFDNRGYERAYIQTFSNLFDYNLLNDKLLQ